jgi:amino acid transporter
MVTMAACSRIVYAMARDSRFPAHRLMQRVSPRTHTPVPATILIFVIGVILMVALPGDALLKLIVSGAIIQTIVYGGTIVLYLAVRKRLAHREGGFSLGRFELPVAISALVWIVVVLFVLMAPADAVVPAIITAGLVLVGGLYFACMLRFNREVLDTEPGEDVFAVSSEVTK